MVPSRSDEVFLVAAETLAGLSSVADLEAGLLFPRFSAIKAVSTRLIAACADFMVSPGPALYDTGAVIDSRGWGAVEGTHSGRCGVCTPHVASNTSSRCKRTCSP